MKRTYLSAVASVAMAAVMTTSFAAPASAQLRLPDLLGGNSQGMSIDPQRGVMTIAPLLEDVTPTVVTISVISTVKTQTNPLMNDPFFREFFGNRGQGSRPSERQAEGAGSGVIIDAGAGHIVTNHHVVDNADEITVTLQDGREVEAKLVGSDPDTDLALLEIKASGLKALPLANSDDVRVGDYVIAIGNPFRLNHTVTTGIVSGLGRSGLSRGGYENFIQTDASINPGNSGGALINTRGELVGINTAIISKSGSSAGIGFAIPSNITANVIDQLERYGETRRGRIGVVIQDLNADLAAGLGLDVTKGALVSQVAEDSAAERAGLKAGDVIVAFNDEAIESSRDIRNAVGFVERGTRNDLTYIRDGRRKTVKINVEEAPDDEGDSGLSANDNGDENVSMEQFEGASFSDIPEGVDLPGGNTGAYVASVDRGSKAARLGLRKGDNVKAVNGEKVTGLAAFEQEVKESGDVAVLTVQRGRTQIFLAFR